MSARRKTRQSSAQDLANGAPTASTNMAADLPSSQQGQTRHSPFLPTTLETALLSIYPATLILGSLFSFLSPTLRSTQSVYSGTHQSYHPPHLAPSYFAQKKNAFNVYFVKKGWLWTTLALAAFALTHPSLGPPLRPAAAATRRRIAAAARWGLATAVWIAVTQWFFGPPLIDRGFRFTGGQCELVTAEEGGAGAGAGARERARELLTGAACKLAGGTWKGGHDISGHVFLLILGSAMLWMEVLPCVLRASGLRESRLVRMFDGRVVSAEAEAEREQVGRKDDTGNDQVASLGVKIALGVAALSWWMLLMTAAFFHTWFEKFTGLLVAFFGVWMVYFLPRGVPALRAAIGMPGV